MHETKAAKTEGSPKKDAGQEEAKVLDEPRGHGAEDHENALAFPALVHGDSLFPIESQLPMINASSIFSNFSPEEYRVYGGNELFQNGGLTLSRQTSLIVKPPILYQEERVASDKRDEGRA